MSDDVMYGPGGRCACGHHWDFLPPAAANMGVRLPDPGQAILHGPLVSQETAFEEAARLFLLAKTVRGLHQAGVAETGGRVG